MKLDGKQIAESMYADLTRRVGELQKKNVTPHLVVFLIGENPASVAYVTLKQRKGEEIGAKVTILRYDPSITQKELEEKVILLNDDLYVHAILIQRPLPDHIDEKRLELLTNPQKDVDGFHPDSPYTLPLPLAVGKILEEVFHIQKSVEVAGVGTPLERLEQTKSAKPSERGDSRQDPVRFSTWLQSQNIVLIGKGPTGGGPIIAYLKTLNVTPQIIDSKTPNPDELTKKADIIISAAGRKDMIKAENIKKGVVLISVGIFRNENNKLSGDYNIEEIQEKAAYFTPTPGGVGPVNVAKLMENLITAAEKQTKV